MISLEHFADKSTMAVRAQDKCVVHEPLQVWIVVRIMKKEEIKRRKKDETQLDSLETI